MVLNCKHIYIVLRNWISIVRKNNICQYIIYSCSILYLKLNVVLSFSCIIQWERFVGLNASAEGNARFVGLCPELTEILAKKLNFT